MTGAGMATYQLGFTAFDALAIVGEGGPPGIRQTLTTPPEATRFPHLDISTSGAAFRLLDASAATTILLAGLDDPPEPNERALKAGDRAVVAQAGPWGVAGQAVSLSGRITATTDDTPGVQVMYQVLSIGGVAVGLVGNTPLRPDVTYTVLRAASDGETDGDTDRATDGDTATFLRSLVTTGKVSPHQPQHTGPAPNAAVCFTHGTLVDTPEGPRRIEDLCPGDLVTTLDNGSQPLRWIGTRAVTLAEMHAHPALRPIRFDTGAMGNQRPLLVSPQHRMLLGDWRAQVYFGEDQVLVAAKAMENDTTIRTVIPLAGVVYCHLLFDRHEVILAEGALSESFHPGEAGLASLDQAQRDEIAALFPHLPVDRRRAAFPIVKSSEAQALRLPG